MPLEIIEAYKKAKDRLFLLDYDGTLVNITSIPSQAFPTVKLIKILKILAQDPHNTVVIVSGRNHQDLDLWLGDLPLAFIAEHGLLCREPNGSWETITEVDTSWKPIIRKVLEYHTIRTPGAFIETKTSTLVWHYRGATNKQSLEETIKLIVESLELLTAELYLRIMYGNKVIEIQPNTINKGLAIDRWLNYKQSDFILAAGDDITDEDLFLATPDTAHKIKIGRGKTSAKLRLDTPDELLIFLSSLTA
jgi:trehalose 6-phosphate synthase/phosphatase